MRWRAHAAVAAAVIPPLLAVVSLSTMARWVAQREPRQRPSDDFDEPSLAAWVDRILRRSPGLWRHTCLRRAGVMFYLLRRAGLDISLRIGVRRDTKKALSAHAWLVREGEPFLEPRSTRLDTYEIIAEFPEDLAAVTP